MKKLKIKIIAWMQSMYTFQNPMIAGSTAVDQVKQEPLPER